MSTCFCRKGGQRQVVASKAGDVSPVPQCSENRSSMKLEKLCKKKLVYKSRDPKLVSYDCDIVTLLKKCRSCRWEIKKVMYTHISIFYKEVAFKSSGGLYVTAVAFQIWFLEL